MDSARRALGGDATAIGYLRHLEPGREIVWWAPNAPFLGAQTCSSWQYRLVPHGDGSRLSMGVDVAAAGGTRWLVILVAPLIDSIMALRQLKNLRDLVEGCGARPVPDRSSVSGEVALASAEGSSMRSR
jgi:hypothetical protein